MKGIIPKNKQILLWGEFKIINICSIRANVQELCGIFSVIGIINDLSSLLWYVGIDIFKVS